MVMEVLEEVQVVSVTVTSAAAAVRAGVTEERAVS